MPSSPQFRTTWISGWGVAPECLTALAAMFAPDFEHRFLPPTPDAVSTALTSDCVVGWSLGAWRILDAASKGVTFPGKVVLLSPFLAFCSDYGLGGRCSITQVRWLRRWLRKSPAAALVDFHRRAGLQLASDQMPPPQDVLFEGLDRLEEDATPALRRFAAQGIPKDWVALIGRDDPLLDAIKIAEVLPGCQVVPGAGHNPTELLAAIATFRKVGNVFSLT